MAETILTVDIDRQLVRALCRAFTGAGYQSLEAHDGEQALEVVQHEQPSLVVLDITLPKRDGFSVLEAIRAMPDPVRQTPVLLTCGGRVTPQYEERAHRLGVQAIVSKPVPVKDLIAHANKISAKPTGAAAVGADAPEQFAGRISDMPLPHVLHRLHALRESGVLIASTARKKKAIELRDGYPVAVKSNLITECLGHHLVRAGNLSEEAASESIARMKKGDGLQGEILVAMDAITPEEVESALREQAEEKLFEMFSWRRGDFRLERGSRLRRANPLAFETSAVNIILEGVRQHASQEDVDAFLELNAERQVRISAKPLYPIDEVDLCDEERALVLAQDGTSLLGDLIHSDSRHQRTLYGLLAAEVLELRSQQGGVVAAASPKNTATAPIHRPEDEELRIELAAMAERLKGKSHFEVLGVDEDASAEDIESAYETLTTTTHPDRFGGSDESVQALAGELFSRVSTAYEVLSDAEARSDCALQMQSSEPDVAERPVRKVAPANGSDRKSRAHEAFLAGEEHLRQKRYEQALREFSSAREASSRNADYVAHHAWCLYLCNPNNATVTQEALAHLRQAVTLARDQEKPYLLLGRLNKVLGNNRDAERNFARAAQICPDSVEACRELRLITMRKGKTRELIGKLIRR